MKQPKNVNERIDEIIMERGLTKQELAAKIGKHITTIDRILSGATTPSYGTTKVIAEALDTPLDYLLKGTGPKENEKITENINPYKDALVSELKSQVEYLKEMLKMALGGKNPNFLKAIGEAPFAKYLPGKRPNSVRAVA